MGWTFNCDKKFDKACLVKKFVEPGFFINGATLIDHRIVGNSFWAVVRLNENGTRMIWLALMEPGGKDQGWGYKSMDETACPSRVDCPLTLIRQCSKPKHENATVWRSEVNQWHDAQAASKKAVIDVKPGMTLVSGDVSYVVIRPAGPRKGWVVEDMAGKLFRMPAAQVSRSVKKLFEPKPVKRPEEQLSIVF